MAEVKWVKITTDMFDNRKIKHLRKLPDGNSIVLIWVMLLTMAGRCNAGGMVFLTENIPYTAKMLADELDFEENTVQLAINALERFGMICTDDSGLLAIKSWEKYQNIEGMERIRESKRLSQARWRSKQKAALPPANDCVESTVESTEMPRGNTDKDIDKDIDIDLKKKIYKEKKAASGEASNPPKKHKHGEYANVLLTDDDLAKLKTEFSDWQQRIERLSAYKASTGKVYKNDLATIRNWARRDGEKKAEEAAQKPKPSYDMDEISKRFALGNIK